MARDSRLPVTRIQALLHDPDEQVTFSAAANPALPVEAMIRFLRTADDVEAEPDENRWLHRLPSGSSIVFSRSRCVRGSAGNVVDGDRPGLGACTDPGGERVRGIRVELVPPVTR